MYLTHLSPNKCTLSDSTTSAVLCFVNLGNAIIVTRSGAGLTGIGEN